MLLRDHTEGLFAKADSGAPRANLSAAARRYIVAQKAKDDSLFFHILAITNSPEYRHTNEGGLRHGWPRVPLPKKAESLVRSTALGRQVADLLLPGKPVIGVTSGRLRADCKDLAIPIKLDGKPIDPEVDLDVTAAVSYTHLTLPTSDLV